MSEEEKPNGRRRTPRSRPPEPRLDDPYAYEDEMDAELGPTDDEMKEWAEAERRRREAWIAGPSDAEKRAWARREGERRHRRAALTAAYPGADMYEIDWLEAKYRRDAELMLEGAVASFLRWPFRMLANNKRAGLAWETEQDLRPHRRRRVPYYADDY
jgi:hypothetical protein